MGKYIRDPIHGLIHISDDELKIVDNPYFQRLRKIKQLAHTYLVFPSAVHTRFEHSLGVCYLCGEFAKRLNLEEDEVKEIRIAGLLHDIGHGPFGHTLEEILIEYKGINHEEKGGEIIKEYFSDILSEIGVDPIRIGKIIKGEVKDIVARILGGGEEKGIRISLDADHLDYLKRDNYFSGAEAGDFSIPYLLKNLVRFRNKIALHRKAIGEINKIILMRTELGRSVYFHKTRIIADEMLVKATYYAIEEGNLDLDKLWLMGDEEAKKYIKESCEYSKDIIERIERRDLYKWAVVGKFEGYGFKDPKVKLEYIDEDFYNKVAKMSLKEKFEIEKEISKEVGCDVIIARTPPLEFREDEIKSNIYIWDGENIVSFDEITSYENLVRMNREIAFISLICDKEYRNRVREISLKDYL